MKNTYTTCILLLIFTSAFCQVERDEKFIQQFTSRIENYEENKSSFVLIKVLNQDIIKGKNIIGLSTRQLSNSLFIIDKKNLERLKSSRNDYQVFNAINNNWKLSPLCDEISKNSRLQEQNFLFTIQTAKTYIPKSILQYPLIYSKSIQDFPEQNILSIRTNWNFITVNFLNDPQILGIDVITIAPKEELAVKGFDLSANKINRVHNDYPDMNGKGQHVSIKENFYDTADIDLKGRFDLSPLASKTVTNHANFMATIIAGAGNSVYYSKGAAWGANISSSSFDIVLPDSENYYKANRITVQNHSYGTDIENVYGVNAVAFDNSANSNPDLLHVFSSGNSGTSSSTTGYYSGLTGFANVTGNFKMAKNNLVTGASDSFGNVVPLSSRGPAYDGRIKPELVAFQMNGTSEAAALVSGSVLLLQQYYKEKNNKSLPSALAKGLLINSADDVNIAGPDYATGFGNMNVAKAMDEIKNNLIWTDSITAHLTKHFNVLVPPNISRLKVTLTWNDAAAKTFAPKALVNDLDLLISNQNNSWQPWVLNSFANVDSLKKPAERKRDSLNNVEQVTIDNPVAGSYDIAVNGYDVSTGNQGFFVTYSLDTLNTFTWNRPGSMDFLQSGTQDIIRWESTYTTKGILEYSYPSSSVWKPLSSNIDLRNNNYQIDVPDTTAPIIFRMRIGGINYYSDTFKIAHLLSPKVGYVCQDSFLMYWERLPGIDSYQIYQLGNEYMVPFKVVSDTSIIINKQSLNNHFLAVAPILKNNKEGVKSYAFDYTTQGAGCYINSFLVEENNNSAHLTLSLGTGFQLQKITFEILTPMGFVPIFSENYNGSLDIIYNYANLIRGINSFRAFVTLSNGKIIYSDIVSVSFIEDGQYKVIPIPVRKFQPLSLISATPSREVFQILDASGRLMFEKLVILNVESISTSKLSKGNYYYRIIKEGKEVGRGRFMVI